MTIAGRREICSNLFVHCFTLANTQDWKRAFDLQYIFSDNEWKVFVDPMLDDDLIDPPCFSI